MLGPGSESNIRSATINSVEPRANSGGQTIELAS